MEPLPLLDQPAPERADAARNREALLSAAQSLISQCGVDSVTMDAVASTAGVGKGTVFRRFGSREGLMAALLNASESAWQAEVMAGPPPIGPGAPPLERLLAFGCSRTDINLKHAELIRAAGRSGSRSYAAASFASMHVRYLLGELGVPGDIGFLATALLAPLEVPILHEQITSGRSRAQIDAGWADLVARVIGR